MFTIFADVYMKKIIKKIEDTREVFFNYVYLCRAKTAVLLFLHSLLQNRIG